MMDGDIFRGAPKASETSEENDSRLASERLLPTELSGPPSKNSQPKERVMYAMAQIPPPPLPGGRFPSAAESDENLMEVWTKFVGTRVTGRTIDGKPVRGNAAPGGFMRDLNTFLGQSTQLRVEDLLGRGKAVVGNDNNVNIRENLEILRQSGSSRDENMNEPMVEFDIANLAVGKRDSRRETGVSNSELVGLEVQRLTNRSKGILNGRPPDVHFAQTLHTIVYENLCHKFPIDKPWTGAKPWSEAEMKYAAFDADGPKDNKFGQDYRLNLNKSDYKKDLERLHDRFLVASIFAKIKEDPNRKMFATTERVKLDNFVLANWEEELKIEDKVTGKVAGGLPWDPEKDLSKNRDVRRVALRWGVTLGEAQSMHDEVQRIKDREPETDKIIRGLK